MSLAALIALILGLSLTAYAVLAGSDFGAGILDLFAGKRSSGRAAIATVIGPLWEANHVWLIFSITILFSAFPAAFAVLGTALLAPLSVALVAIVLRSVALGLRSNPGADARSQAMLGRLFGAMSVVAPLVFGAVAGGVAEVSSSHGTVARNLTSVPWRGAFAIIVGALAVGLCAQLAASFIALRLVRSGRAEAAERFRIRGLQSSGGVLLLSVVGLNAAAWMAPDLWRQLTSDALPLLIAGLAAILTSLFALARRRYLLARTATVITGASLVWGWLLAQSPNLIGTRLTIHSAAATHAALTAIAIAGGIVLLAVLPALYLLFGLFARPLAEVIE
jgi:cytochrome bd ubiquinol oxidase subunit II